MLSFVFLGPRVLSFFFFLNDPAPPEFSPFPLPDLFPFYKLGVVFPFFGDPPRHQRVKALEGGRGLPQRRKKMARRFPPPPPPRHQPCRFGFREPAGILR